MKKNIKIKEYVVNMAEQMDDNAHEVADMLGNYRGNSYICDAISEHADGMVDIYNSDLLEWAKSHLGDIEEANDEFGAPSDIIRQIQQAQYKVYCDELYGALEEGARLFVWKLAAEHAEEVTEEQAEGLNNIEADNNDKIEALEDKVKEILGL